MASVPPKPNLSKSTALSQGQNTVSRLSILAPNMATELSPVTIYQPSSSFTFGATPGDPPTVPVQNAYGVWVAPDLNGDGSTWYASVECFGAGGGGGGGNHTQGGGGGGAGEYAAEYQYPIEPGKSYVYVVGLGGMGGLNTSTTSNPGLDSAGSNGGLTAFDLTNIGLAGGVVANGGQGGDQTSIGIGGVGGTGSANTVHFNGGNGGTNVSGNGSDNPVTLAGASGMFANNTLNSNIVKAWYIMNDSNFSSATRNDSSFNSRTGTWVNGTGGFFETSENTPAAPSQVPAYTSTAGTYGPNQTTVGWTSQFYANKYTAPSARFSCGGLTSINGSAFTISCWLQATQGTWGNTTNGSFALVAGNSTNLNLSSFKGFGLYFYKDGTGTWRIYAQVGNGTTKDTINSNAMPPVSATWYYVVMTYNSGTLSLYVNGALVTSTTTTGYTSVPAGAYATVVGQDPSTAGSYNWFFGGISNLWFATDALTSTGVNQAFGLTAATGGAGGGASGGPSANGGNGSTASGATGGAGGTPATQPANLTAFTTEAMGGFAGSNAGSSNGSPLTPSGGSYGGGGGGCGDMASPPNTTTLVIPFTSAGTYTGIDAVGGAGLPYNLSQQANTNSGVNTLLFAGGLASDGQSGSKNTLLLLPAGLKATLGSGNWTIQNIYLTITNAFPNNTEETILEVGYSETDTVLPQNYQGASLVDYVGAIPIPVGSGTITYDLAPSGFANQLDGFGGGSVATALILGPGDNPTIDAYNAITGPSFYASIYGPGAYDTAGNPLFPYLTIVLQETVTIQQGSDAASGGIIINQASNSTPVAFVEPYAGTDEAGNQFAQSFTGQITNFDPDHLTPGTYKPETWKTITAPTGMTGTFRYKKLAESNFAVVSISATITSTLTSLHQYATAAIDSQYWPANGQAFPCAFNVGAGANQFVPYVGITTGGVIYVECEPFWAAGQACMIQTIFMYALD